MANVKVSIIGLMDMLKFKNMPKVREKQIRATLPKEVSGEFKINQNAKALHPDYIPVVVKEVIGHAGAEAKTFLLGKEDGSALPYFRAGQYLSLKLNIGGSFVTRAYSISSSPKWATEGRYAVTVRRKPGGFAADWMLENLRQGDELVISAPQGSFFHDGLRDAKAVVALAFGGSITPFISMAYAIRDGIEDFDLTILSESRTEDSILLREELDAIAAVCSRVKVIHVLSGETREGFEYGTITSELIKKYAPEDYSIFVCSPGARNRFPDTELAKLSLPERRIRRAASGVTKNIAVHEGYPKDAVDRSFRVTVKQGPAVYEITAKAEEPLLVAFERAGIKAPSGCRSGECGWCRSRLVSGTCFIPEENDSRRWADKKYGFVHPCASFPVSDLVVEIPCEY